jgi:CRISPR-associated exonuclease Cas4
MSRLLFLVPAIALLTIAGGLLLWSSRRLRRAAGLPAGEVISADTGAWRSCEAPLFSSRHRLTGRPDYLVIKAQRIVPVEVKSGAAPRTAHRGHLLQLAAYCLLAEETYGRKVPYGLLHYADATLRVEFSARLRSELLATLQEMHVARSERYVRRSHDEPARCARCGVRHACAERLNR